MKIAVVVSEFNAPVTEKMLEGALLEAKEREVAKVDIYRVPGAVELPFVAKLLAEKGDHDAIVLLGCVIRGATDHYDYVCDQVAYGTQEVILKYGLPVIFGVLTTHNGEQAFERVGGKKGHKGRYAMDAAIRMVELKNSILK